MVKDSGRRWRVVAEGTGRRRRVVARFRTGVPMPCDGRLTDMTCRNGTHCRAWPDCCRSCDMRGPRLLGHPCRAPVAAASWRSGRCHAGCRAGHPDECEFHEVVVHGAPSLSACGFYGEPISPLHQARRLWHPFLTSSLLWHRRRPLVRQRWRSTSACRQLLSIHQAGGT